MRNTTKTFSALLTGALILSPFAVTAFAAEGKTLNITASSNFSPSVTQSIDAATKQITATWWLQDAEDSMVNIQGVLTYDNTKLRVDMTDGVNRTYDVSSDEYTENILCITNGQSTVVNYQPETLPSNANAGIRFNATQSSGFSMGTATERVPFFSVTFNPVDNAEGDTEIHLEIDFMAVRDDNDTTYHKLIHHAEIVDTDADFLPDEAAAIYAGPFDPNYTPAEPTTSEPTTIPPTTVAPTTIAPTTVAPTTVAPTTIAPTTVAPTTIAPTTIAPTTIAPTTVAAPTTIAPTTIAPTTIAPTTIAPTTIAPTTIAPTTIAPTTIAPTTIAPTTIAATTIAPTTIAPTTIAPTTIAPTTKPVPAYILGDVNDDGKVDVSDATLVQMHAAEIVTFDELHLLAGDVNKDGVADITDVTLIQQFAAEIIDHF